MLLEPRSGGMAFRELSFKADQGLSYLALEKEMRRIRKRIGLGPLDQIPHGEALFDGMLDRTTVEHEGREIRIVADCGPIPGEALTIYDPDEGCIVLAVSEDTYEGLRLNLPRARFTLCHEIVHVFVHTAQVLRLGQIPHRVSALYRRKTHKIYEDVEWQADAGAGALLMPAPVVFEALDGSIHSAVPRLETYYGVSSDAAERRIASIKDRRRQLMK